MASEEYKGFHISAWARPEYGKVMHPWALSASRTEWSIVEVQRIAGRSFESKEKAKRYGLELCKEWVDKQKGRST
jgi:hypothetical protein